MKKIIDFRNKKEFFNYLVENKELIITEKKSTIKHADCISLIAPEVTQKSTAPIDYNVDEIKIRAIINTTNLMDSHDDVHLKGIWKKSLQENNKILHLQEHKMQFDKIISKGEDLKAFTKNYNWNELGVDYKGMTEALVFDSVVKKTKNEYMFNQYKDGNVDNHSVGMQYIKIFLAINDENYKEEFEVWKKYYYEIANKEQADSMGYFFAVTEAKVIEGSAVVKGSNWVTPTLSNNMKNEPFENTHKNTESLINTQTINYLIQNFKLK